MGIREAQEAIRRRLAALTQVPEDDRSDYDRGLIAALAWSLEQIDHAVAALLPTIVEDDELDGCGGVDLETEADDEDDPPVSIKTEADDEDDPPVSIVVPARYSTRPCTGEKTHAYEFNTPERGNKRCKWCGDIQQMNHGEKITSSKRARKSEEKAVWEWGKRKE